ncbi:MAG: HDOD domain-containing protein [Phycisphaerales bacterium]
MAPLNPKVAKVIDACPELPVVPAVLARITAMIASDQADARALGEIVQHDEALAARVLRCANSAAFGVPGKTFDLPTSIARLGSRELVRIITRHEAAKMLPSTGTVYGLSRGALWRNAVGGAIAAEMLAVESGATDPQQAYVAALLRDIGKLVIETVMGKAAIASVPDSDGSHQFVESEREALGLDHAELGAALAEQWGLPDTIVHAIRFHHEPPHPGEPAHDPLIDVVHAADMICLWSGLGAGDDGAQYALADHAREALAMDRKSAEAMAATTWERVRELESELGIAA